MDIEKTLKQMLLIGNVKLTILLILTLTFENVWIRAILLFCFVVTFVKSFQVVLDLTTMKVEEVEIEELQVDSNGDITILTDEYEYFMEDTTVKNPKKCKLKILKYSKIPIEIIDVD